MERPRLVSAPKRMRAEAVPLALDQGGARKALPGPRVEMRERRREHRAGERRPNESGDDAAQGPCWEKGSWWAEDHLATGSEDPHARDF